MKKTLFFLMFLCLHWETQAQVFDATGWVTRDSTWSNLGAMDDGSSSQVNLPFNFCFFAGSYNAVWVNNNGNVSFGAPNSGFTSYGFPSNDPKSIAPFYADVDTRGPGSGFAYYKVFPNCIVVQWDRVGYYSSKVNKLNTFQLVMSDGTLSQIGLGNSVSFTYKSMQWFDGDASLGVPAVVGVNMGDGVNFYQIGRFGLVDTLYNGVNGLSGIKWLENKTFSFDACNFPPVIRVAGNIDTLKICKGDTTYLDISATGPEPNQNVTLGLDTPLINGVTVVSQQSGAVAQMRLRIIGSLLNSGVNFVSIKATDNYSASNASSTKILTLLAVDKPVIVSQPTHDTVCVSHIASFVVNATGSALTYQWQVDTGLGFIDIINNANYSGATTNQLNLLNTSLTLNNNNYRCVLYSTGMCPVISNVVRVNVKALIDTAISVSGVISICAGTTLSVSAQSNYQYQWYRNNILIAGATQVTLNVTDSGDYTVVLKDVGACVDSAISSVLKVNLLPVAIVNQNQSICQINLPFTWNGKTVNTLGIHVLRDTTISLVTNCDSVTILTVVVNPPLAVSLNQTICEQALPFVWNGQTVTSVGTFTLTDTRASLVTGCDSITTVTMLVNPTNTASVSQIICEQVLPFTWNGQTINSVGNFTLVDTSASLITSCDSITTLTLTVNQTKTNSVNQIICQNTLPFLWNGQTVNTVGTHTLRDTSTSLVTNCDSITTLVLVVLPSPIVSLGADITSCEQPNWAKLIDATTTGATAYLWNTTAVNPSITVTQNGTYSVEITDAQGCIGRDTIVVNIRLMPQLDLGANLNICEYDTVLIDATTAGVATYLWSTNAITPSIKAWTTGLYKVTVTATNGCIGTDSVQLDVHANPVVNLGTDYSICLDRGSIEFLNARNPGSIYLWDNNYNGQIRTIDQSGKYWVGVTNVWGCSAYDTIAVDLRWNPEVNLPNDTTVCENAMVRLDAGNEGIQYYWNTGATTSTIMTNLSGNHVVVVTGQNGCVVMDSIFITQNGSFPSHDGIWIRNRGLRTFEFTLVDGAYITDYAWDFGDGSPLDYNANPIHTYGYDGNYIVRLRLNSICGATNDTSTVHVINQSTGIDDLSRMDIKVYPNPTKDWVNIEADIPLSLHLHTIDGRLLKSIEKAKQIDMKDEIQGMYMLHVKDLDGNLLKVFKIIKE